MENGLECLRDLVVIADRPQSAALLIKDEWRLRAFTAENVELQAGKQSRCIHTRYRIVETQ